MPFRFVHAADLHLDSPCRGIPADGALTHTFQRATFGAFSRIVDLCLRERVDFLILAGDLFDARDRSIRARLGLRQELCRLDGAGIPTFIVHGNHDPLGEDSPALKLPSTVKVFGASWEEVPFVRGGEVICRLQGISYPQERVTENLCRSFRRMGPEFTIGILHANVGSHAEHADYAPCTLDDLASRNLDYWALGHVHNRAELALGPSAVAVYPGNPQGRHIKETGERGCVLVEVDGQRSQRQFIPLDLVRWHRLDVDLGGIDALDGLESAIEERLAPLGGSAHQAHAVRIALSGRGPLHRELARPGARTSLEEHLRASLLLRDPPIVLEALEDATRAQLDFNEILSSGGLGAALVAAAKSARSDAAALEALWDAGGLSRLESALRGGSVSIPRDSALVTHALGAALDHLQIEEGIED